MAGLLQFKCGECGVNFNAFPPGEGYTKASLEPEEGAKALPYYCRNDHKNMVYWTKD
ncbi:MAG: hypothetical protein ACE5HJ_08910 [Thermoplasmata archaeon]